MLEQNVMYMYMYKVLTVPSAIWYNKIIPFVYVYVNWLNLSLFSTTLLGNKLRECLLTREIFDCTYINLILIFLFSVPCSGCSAALWVPSCFWWSKDGQGLWENYVCSSKETCTTYSETPTFWLKALFHVVCTCTCR